MTAPPTVAGAALPLRRPWRKIQLACAAVLIGALVCMAWARAGDMSPAAAPAQEPAGTHSVLDGRSFVGEIGPVGEAAFTKDVWEFRDGTFVSKECQERCGYPRSPYWVRFQEDAVQFRSKSTCPDTEATIVWKGVVKGDRIEGTFTWTRERWYWTVQKDFWFEGRLVKPAVAMSPQ